MRCAQRAAGGDTRDWQQFRSITLPSLRPILPLVITLQVIASPLAGPARATLAVIAFLALRHDWASGIKG